MGKKKILLIEDNPYNMCLICDILQINGYDVYSGCTEVEAFRILENHKPALILMDISLKDTDGLTLTKKIKSIPAYHDIPIIALTAHAMENNRQDALNAGCDYFIAKPINTREFPKIIAKAIEHN